jgi:hypothetical protein
MRYATCCVLNLSIASSPNRFGRIRSTGEATIRCGKFNVRSEKSDLQSGMAWKFRQPIAGTAELGRHLTAERNAEEILGRAAGRAHIAHKRVDLKIILG